MFTSSFKIKLILHNLHENYLFTQNGGGGVLAGETVSLVLQLILLFVSVKPTVELSLFVIIVQHHAADC